MFYDLNLILPLLEGDIGCRREVETFVGEPASVFLAEAEQVNCLVLEDQVSSLYEGSCRSARRWVRSPPLSPCRFVFMFVHAFFFNLGSSVTTIGCDFISLW